MKKYQGMLACLPLVMCCAAYAGDAQSDAPSLNDSAGVPVSQRTIKVSPEELSGDITINSQSANDLPLAGLPDSTLEEQQKVFKQRQQDKEEYSRAVIKNWTKEIHRDENSYSVIYKHLAGQKAIIFKLNNALTLADKPEEAKHAAARGVEFYARMTAYEYKVNLSDLSMLNAHTYKMRAEINGSRFMIFVSKMEGEHFYLKIFALGGKVSYEDITLLTPDFFRTQSLEGDSKTRQE